MSKRLFTPFGELLITLNNIEIDYNYSVKKVFLNFENKEVDIYSIDIDLSNNKINDIIECKIKNVDLKFNSSDENVDLLSIENNDIILGISGYEPEIWGYESQYDEVKREKYCYELDDYYSGKFEYKIYRNPKKYLDKHKSSYIINIKVCWLNKNEFQDSDDSLFMAIC